MAQPHPKQLEWLGELQGCFEIYISAAPHRVTALSETPLRHAVCSSLLPQDLPSLSLEGESGIAQSKFHSHGDKLSL